MSDQYDWDFAGADDAKLTIRAAVHYLLKGTAGNEPDRALIRQVCSLQLRIEQLDDRDDASADEVIRLSSEHRRLLTALTAGQ